MSDIEINSTPLQQAYRAARLAAGKAEVHRCIVAHGAASGVLSEVAANRQESLLKALQQLAANGDHQQSRGNAAPKTFADLDPQAVMDRWNATPTGRTTG
jgi:hypothetical protein